MPCLLDESTLYKHLCMALVMRKERPQQQQRIPELLENGVSFFNVKKVKAISFEDTKYEVQVLLEP